MRVEKTIKNIKIAMLYQITILLIAFIDRKLFLSVLGVNYLGLHGLFGNIITMLSLAELGVGTAIIYNLYKPLEEQDKEEVAALMQLYKKVYYVIGLVIGVIGVMLMFFLPILIKEPMQNMTYVRGVYLVFLAGTVLTYLTGYKRAILYADQKNYILLLGDMMGNTVGVLAKVITLLTLKNYMAYVVVHSTFKVLPNIWAGYQVNRRYPYINKLKTVLPLEKLQKVKENIKDLFIHKISHFVVTSTDSLIISSFIGISAVGYMANYNMIIGALMGFVAQGVEALQASMGNLVVSRSEEKVEEVYDRLTFVSFWIGSLCAVALVSLVQPFVELWLGADYFLQNGIVMVMIINFFLWILTRPLWQMMSVAGLFKEDKINAIVEMIVNLIFSLMLVQRLGLIGVLIGTTISYLVAWMMKSHLLYRKFFKKPSTHYYGKIIIYSLITVLEVILVYTITAKISIPNPYISFGTQIIICAILPNVINYILFSKTKDLRYFEKLIKGVMMNLLKKIKTDKMIQLAQKTVFVLVAILIFALPIDTMRIPMGTTIGKLAAVAIFMVTGLYIAYIMVIPGVIEARAKKALGTYFIGAILLALYSLLSKGMVALKPTMMMVLILNTGIAFAYIDYSRIGKWIYLLDIGILSYLVMIISDYIQLGEKPATYEFLFTNPNYLGLLSVLMIFICLINYSLTDKKRYLTYPVPLIWLAQLSNSRTAILALVAAGIVYLFWKVVTRNKIAYYGFFTLMLSGIVGITMFYPIANTLPVFEKINNSILEKTGKDLFSGRQKQWVESVELIQERPIKGYGMEATLEDLTEGDLNTHNVYLQLLLQGGILLLGLFIVLITWMWVKLYSIANSAMARSSASTLVGILVIGTFELTLLGQSISFGIIQWFIIGAGLSLAIYKSNKTKEKLQELK